MEKALFDFLKDFVGNHMKQVLDHPNDNQIKIDVKNSFINSLAHQKRIWYERFIRSYNDEFSQNDKVDDSEIVKKMQKALNDSIKEKIKLKTEIDILKKKNRKLQELFVEANKRLNKKKENVGNIDSEIEGFKTQIYELQEKMKHKDSEIAKLNDDNKFMAKELEYNKKLIEWMENNKNKPKSRNKPPARSSKKVNISDSSDLIVPVRKDNISEAVNLMVKPNNETNHQSASAFLENTKKQEIEPEKVQEPEKTQEKVQEPLEKQKIEKPPEEETEEKTEENELLDDLGNEPTGFDELDQFF